MDKSTCIFTIASKNYLAHARTLLVSAKEHHPDATCMLLLADRIDGRFDAQAEGFEVMETSALGIDDFKAFAFKYNIIEFNTAVKPFFMHHLFTQRGFDRAIYLDPDILIFRPLDHVTRGLDTHSVVLTPHITAPLPDDGHAPRDIDLLKVGVYNLGFIALRKTDETLALVEWWRNRLYDQCLQSVAMGYAVDQIWMSQAPCLVSDVLVLRHPGYNVAYWNLHERTITREADAYLINGEPLHFFHFSGFDHRNIRMLSKYQDRFTVQEGTPLAGLYELYRERVIAKGHEECSRWPYAFGAYSDGARIGDMARTLSWGIRLRSDEFGDPFDGFWGRMISPRYLGRAFGMRPVKAIIDRFLINLWKRTIRR